MSQRVGINLLWLVPGVVGGSEESTVRAIDAVADRVDAGTTDVEPVLFVLPSFLEAHARLVGRLEAHVAPVDGASRIRRVVAESTWLSLAVRREGVDLVHHAGGVVPLGSRRPVTLTIHDLQPLDLPANFSGVKRTYLRAMSGRSARRAELVAVPSTFTAGRVQDLLQVDAERLVVVPWSAPAPPDAAGDDRTSVLPGTLAGLGDEAPLFLYPAITYPHKNHEVLVRALVELDRTAPGAQLAFCGRPGPGDEEVRSASAAAGVADRVHLLGRVDTATIEALYRRATATVYPSRYEGFGLPVLEAMARGCPVIAADVPALVEVSADATLLVGPDDVDGWARAMLDLVASPTDRAELAAAGRARAETFDPGRTAEGLLGIWSRALARS